jgi:hypothetical protein
MNLYIIRTRGADKEKVKRLLFSKFHSGPREKEALVRKGIQKNGIKI